MGSPVLLEMAEPPPNWLDHGDRGPAKQEAKYLTTRLAARPWEAAPPSPAHRYLLRGAIAAALLLLGLVLWSMHGQIRLG